MKTMLMLLIIILGPAISSVQAANTPGTLITKWGEQGAGAGQFSYPSGIAIGPDGSVYVVDHGNNRIQKFSNSGEFILQWGSYGSGNGQFDQPVDVAVDGSGAVYVIENTNQRVQKFTSSGTFVTKWGQYGSCDGQFEGAVGIGVDSNGSVYVADQGNGRIQKFTDSGEFVTKWGSWDTPCNPGDSDGRLSSGDVAVNDGAVIATDLDNQGFKKYSTSGSLLGSWGGPGGTGPGQFSLPYGVAIDGEGKLYISDVLNNRVQILSANGGYLSEIGTFGHGDGQFDGPLRVAVDGAGNVFVVDTNNHRIQKFSGDFGATSIRPSSWGQVKDKYR